MTRRRIYALKCEDKANIRTHIESMKALHEQLNGMGERIEDQDFVAVVLALLPKTYWPLIDVISLQNKMAPSSITPQVIIEMDLDEFNWLQIEEDQSKGSESALIAKGKMERQKRTQAVSIGVGKSEVEWWTCGEKGHLKLNCPKRKGKKKKGGKAKDHSVATATV